MTPAQKPAAEPIDGVYLWDGTGDLRYSLRSLSRHAPWIRKVYVVTGAPAPAWLVRGHARLAVVKHEDLIRDRVASVEAIAWHLFRIPGLSRQFLCLDGNLYLGRPLSAGDFLTAKGGYHFLVEPNDIPPGTPAENLLNSRFGNRSPRKKVASTPRLLDRNFVEEANRLWEKQIKQGGIALDTLYFYFLLENPLQRGVHEKAALTGDMYDCVSLSDTKRVRKVLFGSPLFFRLEGAPSFAARVLLKLRYWRRSAFEK